MIGPHQGRELELMLEGKKRLAVFCEAVIEGKEIPEEIIPEKAFAPYIATGLIKRFSQDFISSKIPFPGRYVCFTPNGHEWRAQAFLWLKQESISGHIPFDETYERFVGRLLD
jgi:hypothetical protein